MVCGLCGLGNCSIDLARGSGRGKTTSYIPSSNCEYSSKFSIKSAETPTKSGPCSDRPVSSHICNIQWSYNIPKHYQDKHSNRSIPLTMTDTEKQLLGL